MNKFFRLSSYILSSIFAIMLVISCLVVGFC